MRVIRQSRKHESRRDQSHSPCLHLRTVTSHTGYNALNHSQVLDLSLHIAIHLDTLPIVRVVGKDPGRHRAATPSLPEPCHQQKSHQHTSRSRTPLLRLYHYLTSTRPSLTETASEQHRYCFCPFTILPMVVSANARQPIVPAWFPRSLRPDVQDRRHRTESVRFQHPGPPWSSLDPDPRPILQLHDALPSLTASLSALPALNAGAVEAGIDRLSPVCGLRPVRAGTVPGSEGSESRDPHFLAICQGLAHRLEHSLHRVPGRRLAQADPGLPHDRRCPTSSCGHSLKGASCAPAA